MSFIEVIFLMTLDVKETNKEREIK